MSKFSDRDRERIDKLCIKGDHIFCKHSEKFQIGDLVALSTYLHDHDDLPNEHIYRVDSFPNQDYFPGEVWLISYDGTRWLWVEEELTKLIAVVPHIRNCPGPNHFCKPATHQSQKAEI